MSTDEHGPGDALESADASPDRFPNPGLPPHRERTADRDPRAAQRAERQVAFLFGLSAVGTLLFLVAYFAVKFDGDLTLAEHTSRLRLSNTLLGLGLFLAMFCIGIGAVHWAKTLMPDEERVEERHDLAGTAEDQAAALAILREGADESGIARRPLIRNSLVGALALTPLPVVAMLRDAGPMPEDSLSTTLWAEGKKLVLDPEGAPVKASDLQIGSVAHVLPEGIDEAEHPLDEKAKAAVLVMRLDPGDLDEASTEGAYQGIVAYSKICTHMGCPVGLYEQQTHHLLCPCHQSTFDLTQNCKVIFGPAKRALPQLPITVDDEGYLVARSGFAEAVGPSFWERG